MTTYIFRIVQTDKTTFCIETKGQSIDKRDLWPKWVYRNILKFESEVVWTPVYSSYNIPYGLDFRSYYPSVEAAKRGIKEWETYVRGKEEDKKNYPKVVSDIIEVTI